VADAILKWLKAVNRSFSLTRCVITIVTVRDINSIAHVSPKK